MTFKRPLGAPVPAPARRARPAFNREDPLGRRSHRSYRREEIIFCSGSGRATRADQPPPKSVQPPLSLRLGGAVSRPRLREAFSR